MSISKAIIWLDDASSRAPMAAEIGATFVDVHSTDVGLQVEKLLKGRKPSLVILDHVLDKTSATNPIFMKGSTIAEAVKEKWPACPVVGVTSASPVDDIDSRTRGTYDALLPYHNFGQYIGTIEAIRRGFSTVSKNIPKTDKRLVQLLRAPADDIDRLLASIPDNLKAAMGTDGSVSPLFRWIEKLTLRPGFLYDSLWAATFLGITEGGFEIVKGDFKRAQYAGIFAPVDRPRWWASRLAEQLYKRCPPAPRELSWHTGPRLPGIHEKHFSKCYRCNEPFPETVAFLDAASDQRRAMHLRCTVLDPRFKRELYFEDMRMMRSK